MSRCPFVFLSSTFFLCELCFAKHDIENPSSNCSPVKALQILSVMYKKYVCVRQCQTKIPVDINMVENKF